MHKNAKKRFPKFSTFSPHDAFKKYLTKKVVTHYTFREYIHLPAKKNWSKKIDKQGRSNEKYFDTD